MGDIFLHSKRYDFHKETKWHSSYTVIVMSAFVLCANKFTSFEIMKSKTPGDIHRIHHQQLYIFGTLSLMSSSSSSSSFSLPKNCTKCDKISLTFHSLANSSEAIYFKWAHNNNELGFSSLSFSSYFFMKFHFFWCKTISPNDKMSRKRPKENGNLRGRKEGKTMPLCTKWLLLKQIHYRAFAMTSHQINATI